MSLMLGIYAKNKELQREEFEPVIEDFALYGKRESRTKTLGNIFFASTFNEDAFPCLLGNENKDLMVAFTGDVYGFDENVVALEKKGYMF